MRKLWSRFVAWFLGTNLPKPDPMVCQYCKKPLTIADLNAKRSVHEACWEWWIHR